jgi:23S rRNA (cytidine1920-2'-O)/16S rRNA (cytidine1409-2'-O)-methyltransferase
MRLDLYLKSYYQTTRNRAQFWIDSGLVLVNKKIIIKASYQMDENDCIEIIEDRKIDWVSRSAVKLDDFLEANKIQIKSLQCLDVGSSTGGFTQVLLSR